VQGTPNRIALFSVKKTPESGKSGQPCSARCDGMGILSNMMEGDAMKNGFGKSISAQR
jgi:hypothetical protein